MGPGLVFYSYVDRIEARISTRTITSIDPQDVITKDITLKVNAVVYFKVVDAMKAVINIENYLYATVN